MICERWFILSHKQNTEMLKVNGFASLGGKSGVKERPIRHFYVNDENGMVGYSEI